MSTIDVHIGAVRAANARLTGIRRNVGTAKENIRRAQSSIDRRVFGKFNLHSRMQAVDSEINAIENQLQNIQTTVANILNRYEDMDRELARQFGSRNILAFEPGTQARSTAFGVAGSASLFGARTTAKSAFGFMQKIESFFGNNANANVQDEIVALDRMSDAVVWRDVNSYKTAIEHWISAELGFEFGDMDLIFFIHSKTPSAFFDLGGCPDLWIETGRKNQEILLGLMDLRDRLACGGNPNQLEAVKYMIRKWGDPNGYFWDTEWARMRDNAIKTIISAGVNVTFTGIKLLFPPVGVPLSMSYKTLKFADFSHRLGNASPNELREAHEHAMAGLSINMALYNDLRTNGRATQTDIDKILQQTLDSTSAILRIEKELEMHNNRALDRTPFGEREIYGNSPFSPPPHIQERERALQASQQRLEDLQRSIDAVETLRTGESTQNVDVVLSEAVSLFSGQGRR